MASINQGDDAVERLDNAVTAFEQIMTGPEGQTVAVPGHQPQPTLAERVKQNLKPSTDAAAGYATQAAASAKAADDAAKLASQITGLETVADAIGIAALPLPDVWAPLSDSLRLITGYGRDVLVGSDVVARMVNFSRNSTATYIGKDGVLKTAAANEPRFEKEGLLIEGQSTNLVPWSEDTARWSKNNSPTIERMSGVYTKVTPSGPASGIYLGGLSLTPGLTYTFSFWGYADAAASVRIGFGNEPSGAALVSSLTTTPTRYTKTFVATLSGDALIAYGGYGVRTPFYVGAVQVEELPLASSYIPTNGAAVTRAPDTCWLLSQQNLVPVVGGPDGAPLTIACEVNALPGTAGGSETRTVVDIGIGSSAISLDSSGVNLLVRVCNGPFVITPLVGGKALGLVRQSEVVACSNKNVIAKTASTTTVLVPTTRPLRIGYWSAPDSGVGDANIRNLWGHVRNLRIWRRNLTDDQIKVVA